MFTNNEAQDRFNQMIADDGLAGLFSALGVTDFPQEPKSVKVEADHIKIVRHVPGDNKETVSVKVRLEDGVGNVYIKTEHNGDFHYRFNPESFKPKKAQYSVIDGILKITIPRKKAEEFEMEMEGSYE